MLSKIQKPSAFGIVFFASALMAGVSFVPVNASAQEHSPFVGGTDRAFENEAMQAEADMLSITAMPVQSSGASLMINPFPLQKSPPPGVAPEPIVEMETKAVVVADDVAPTEEEMLEEAVEEVAELLDDSAEDVLEEDTSIAVEITEDVTPPLPVEPLQAESAPVSIKPDYIVVPIEVKEPQVERTEVKEVQGVTAQEVRIVSAQPQSANESIRWNTPPQITRWRALRGAELKSMLALWAREGGMKFIWSSDRAFFVKETFSIRGTYEQALQKVLDQYNGDVIRPYGQVYRDPDNGERVLVIRADR